MKKLFNFKTKMDAPQRRGVPVDVQLEDFETDLQNSLEFQLVINLDRRYWEELDGLANHELHGIETAIAGSFRNMSERYEKIPAVINILEHCRILILNCVWTGMNVPWPRNVDLHTERVVENAMTVYNEVIYAHLRTEMIMVCHHAEVLQRNWRRCISDPSHSLCRRRLIHEFEALRDE
jgi:hypothetical protein